MKPIQMRIQVPYRLRLDFEELLDKYDKTTLNSDVELVVVFSTEQSSPMDCRRANKFLSDFFDFLNNYETFD